MPRLLIVDDSPMIRRAVRDFLGVEGSSWEICGEAAGAENGFQLCRSLEPDAILIDLSLSEGNGLDLALRVKGTLAGTRIVVMSEHSPRVLEILATTYDVEAVDKSMLSSHLIDTLNRAIANPG
ncbi:MAG TPA: response regulator [Candidatus Sulfotelmatobacter sp.]|nr:response regulator [Candidatus Sulfotelmatobacter sp.]